LRQLQWVGKDSRAVPNLDDEVVADAPLSLIRSIQLLQQFEPVGNNVSQDVNGELLIITGDMHSKLLPARVSQAEAHEEEGAYITADGDIVFITASMRVVLSYPVLAQSSVFVDALLSLGLHLGYGDRANLLVTPIEQSAQAL